MICLFGRYFFGSSWRRRVSIILHSLPSVFSSVAAGWGSILVRIRPLKRTSMKSTTPKWKSWVEWRSRARSWRCTLVVAFKRRSLVSLPSSSLAFSSSFWCFLNLYFRRKVLIVGPRLDRLFVYPGVYWFHSVVHLWNCCDALRNFVLNHDYQCVYCVCEW